MSKKTLALVELTPEVYRCIIGSCPAVFEAEDGDLIVVGATVSVDSFKELEGKVGTGEKAVRISRSLVEGALE